MFADSRVSFELPVGTARLYVCMTLTTPVGQRPATADGEAMHTLTHLDRIHVTLLSVPL